VHSISGRLKLAGLILATAFFSACTEKLDNSAGCPILCPSPGGEIETVTLDAVSLDSTISALTGLGTETSLLLATRGDTLDSRAVIRFDGIPARYPRSSADTTSTAITAVDSVLLRLRIDTVGGKVPATLTLDLYDVDGNAADTAIDQIAALFTPARLIASATFDRAGLKDTINVAVPGSAILSRLGGRLRIGVRARGQSRGPARRRSCRSGFRLIRRSRGSRSLHIRRRQRISRSWRRRSPITRSW
jgi:hypothetical protein